MIDQPAIPQRQPFALRDDDDVCAVEGSILRALRERGPHDDLEVI